ncbi:MAG: phosphodiester glycosidase family protein [Bacteroidota bacterium]
MKFFPVVFLLFLFQNAFSQNADSLAIVKTKWTVSKVFKKTKLVTHHFNNKDLFGANQNISYIEVKNRGKSPVFSLGSEVKILKPTSKFGADNHAIVSLNGTFFDVKNGGSVDFIKVIDTIISPNRLNPDNSRSAHQQAAIAINKGKMTILKWNGQADWESNLGDESLMVSGPLLSLNKKDEALDSSSFNITRHPRTAIGIKRNGNIVLLTVDGRNENAAGMNLFELKNTLKWLGCVSSINLDGGGSTTLWVTGFPENGVINYPTDNKKWDHSGERNVANVILLKKKP